jgi:hypothetical protein
LDLKRMVYGFGYPDYRHMHELLMVEMLYNLKRGQHVSCSELDGMHPNRIKFIKKWSNFCRCCERHRQNRHNNEALYKPPANDCPCSCRRCYRLCLNYEDWRDTNNIMDY